MLQSCRGDECIGQAEAVLASTGPFEQGGGTATISYEYHAEAGDPWVLARHVDAANAGTTIDTVTFIDGLGREIQTKQDASIAGADGSPASEQVIVPGAVHFDAFRRAVAEFHPTTEAPGTPGTFHGATDTVSPDGHHLQRARPAADRHRAGEPGHHVRVRLRQGAVVGDHFTVLETDPGGMRTRNHLDGRESVVAVEQLHKPPSGPQQNLLTRYSTTRCSGW